MAVEAHRFYEFGPFRLDGGQKLLFRDGRPVPLTPKALETLLALVENGGRLVTKEDLMKRVWPDSFVEDGSLTFNISQIRNALGDDRNNGNRFIETIPRRGYRFIAPINRNGAVTLVEPADPHAEAGSQPVAPPAVAARKHGRYWSYLVALALVAVGTIAFVLSRSPGPPRVVHTTQLTSNRLSKWELITDGHRVYFSQHDGIREPWTASISARGGAIETVASDPPFYLEGISADQSTKLLQKGDGTVWTVGPPSGLPQRLGEIEAAGNARWSPDERSIAYTHKDALYLANADGSNPRTLFTAHGNVSWPRWSPDGKSVRFSLREENAESITDSLWEIAADGSNPHRLLPGWHNPPSECCGDWTADGRYYVFQYPAAPGERHRQLWAIREKGGPLGRRAQPVQLTSGPTSFTWATPSPDDKRMFAVGETLVGELQEWDPRRNEFVPYMGGQPWLWLTFSSDRSWIAYVDYATNTLWRAQADGTQQQQLTFERLQVDCVSISPDGKTIAFRGVKEGRSKIYLIPSTGGVPQPLIPDFDKEQGFPSWSPDGRKIVFGDVPKVWAVDDGTHAIRVYALDNHTLSSLPGSEGLWTARWSPDGRYIAAITISLALHQDLKLYDTQAKTWRDLRVEHLADPVWSRDSKYLYARGEGDLERAGIFRVRISDGKRELVAPYGTFQRVEGWVGLTPDDSLMMLRNLGSIEIYALDMDWP